MKLNQTALHSRYQQFFKIRWGGNLDSSLEPSDQVVKVGEDWVDLESGIFAGCWVAKRVNITLI
jgi:hypothetical protein